MRTEKIRVRMLAGLLAAGLVLSLPAGGALALGEGTFTVGDAVNKQGVKG